MKADAVAEGAMVLTGAAGVAALAVTVKEADATVTGLAAETVMVLQEAAGAVTGTEAVVQATAVLTCILQHREAAAQVSSRSPAQRNTK